MKTGRPLTTGKYQTRQELIEAVVGFYSERRLSDAQIARIVGVSPTCVITIVHRHFADLANK